MVLPVEFGDFKIFRNSKNPSLNFELTSLSNHRGPFMTIAKKKKSFEMTRRLCKTDDGSYTFRKFFTRARAHVH